VTRKGISPQKPAQGFLPEDIEEKLRKLRGSWLTRQMATKR